MRIGQSTVAAVTWLILGLAARTATAQTVVKPVEPRVFHVPTAWLEPDGAVFASVGISHTVAPFIGVSVGVGGVAEIDLQMNDTSEGVTIPTALFKTGVAPGRLGAWQPAVALAFRKSIAVPALAISPATFSPRSVQTAQLSVVLSKSLGQVDVHLGVDAWDASDAPGGPRSIAATASDRLRPFAALEWHPSFFPRTTAMLDFSWAPNFAQPGPLPLELQWVGAFGIRYQALSWGSIELGVQERQADVSAPTVFVRLSVWTLSATRF